ncbi:unc-57 [Pristionchus pacificus]|uniref:Unc-57 n=1 Tax=Pristionchus pacificus TaxID=54126 RepID=A0A2A6BNC1_PRIPA|nr:unc-57 [Pristionchus pacificus]|eukprot:PDM67399.1 unc-57 [Pristionchus pacificus]
MSLSGLRKQFNKANQYLSETMGAAEPTKLDDEFNEMERKVDVTYELITNMVAGVSEYLQPNPATRAKMATMGAISKVRGTTKNAPYPQTEGMLAETMTNYGKKLGEDSDLGKALVDSGEAYRQCADIKYQMEDTIKRNFVDPLTHMQNNELKDVNHHRTKLKGRRLDYDCKKRKQTRDDELIQAEEKLEESKKLAEMAIFNVLSNDIEQISQLSALVDAQLDFHRQTSQVLEMLQTQLKGRIKEASCKPRTDHNPKPVLDMRTPRSRSPAPDGMNSGFDAPPSYASNGGGAAAAAPSWTPAAAQMPPPKSAHQPAAPVSHAPKAAAKALFDFDAQNEGELDFKEGDMIELITQVDENWFEGRNVSSGKAGLFPCSYVQVIVPLR